MCLRAAAIVRNKDHRTVFCQSERQVRGSVRPSNGRSQALDGTKEPRRPDSASRRRDATDVDGVGQSPWRFSRSAGYEGCRPASHPQFRRAGRTRKSSRPQSASQLSTTQHRRRFQKRVGAQGDTEQADTSDSIILSIIPEELAFTYQEKC